MRNINGAKILTLEKMTALRLELPESWKKAAGLLRKKKISALKYQRQIRQEWEKRLAKFSA